MVTAWAKKRRAGAFRTDSDAYFSLVGTACNKEGASRLLYLPAPLFGVHLRGEFSQ